MKKSKVVILSILTWFFMLVCLSAYLLVCFPSNETSNETRGQLAYENIKTAHEIAMRLKIDMKSIPNPHDYDFFTRYGDDYGVMSDAAWGFINDLNYGNEKSKYRLVGSAFMSVIKDEYGKDFLKEIKANTTPSMSVVEGEYDKGFSKEIIKIYNPSEFGYICYFCNYSECRLDFYAQSAALTRTIIRVYERTGEIGKAERALAEADKQLQKLKNEDYEHYEALKKYYDSTIAFFDRARLSEVGSDFDSTFEALENYEDDTRHLCNISCEYEAYLDDVFGES